MAHPIRPINVTISLVSYNQHHDLERLLPSLICAANQVQSEILLVDCNSDDGTVPFVKEKYHEIDIFINSNRAGYGENHNINLTRGHGRYFVIMNSDMVVDSDVFIKLFDFLEKHEDVGIVSPKILNEDGTIQGLNKRYPSLTDLFIRLFFPNRLKKIPIVNKRLQYYEMRDIGYDHCYEVPFLSGAFMFCRTDLLLKLGGFDNRYFLYWEDADLCRRVQKTHRTVYDPSASVIHYWKRDSHKKWIFTCYSICSIFRYFNRWGYKII